MNPIEPIRPQPVARVPRVNGRRRDGERSGPKQEQNRPPEQEPGDEQSLDVKV